MASSETRVGIVITIVLLLSVHQVTGCYSSIFSFGDSLADTGNILASAGDSAGAVSRLPYGETYFHRPTGRYSDGRLIIDFIVPLLRPYLGGGSDEDFRHGANFAVGGATALNSSFFRDKEIDVSWTEYSLQVQIEWFKQLLRSIPSVSGEERNVAGFEEPLSACCVGCGGPSARLCSDPSSYVSWDGLHLTEAAYRTIADGLLKGPLAVPSLNQTCPNVQQSSASTDTPKMLCFSISMISFAWLRKKSTPF
ncbi:hypothetical protein GW17_00042529 [Ensete ventricosum]|nr:hypothetical protein GW17_00042529 [Ensete ventricosum]